jgi:hypothetical protein
VLLFHRAQVVFIHILHRFLSGGENKAQRLKIVCLRIRRDGQESPLGAA